MGKVKSKKNHIKKIKPSPNDKFKALFIKLLAIWLFLLPCIVFFKSVRTPIIQREFLMGEQQADFFTYYKMVWLYLGSLFFFISALMYKLYYSIAFKLDKFKILLLAMAISALSSFLLSSHKAIAWWGFVDRYEGTLTWLCYLLVAYSVYVFATEKKHIYTILKGIVYSSTVVGLIGLFQFMGLDLYKSSFGKMLILGEHYAKISAGLDFNMPVGMVYSTLFNPNYIGSYTVLILPLIAMLFINSKKIMSKIVYLLLGLLNIVILIGSRSTGGLIALLVIAVIFVMVIGFKTFYKKDKKIFITSIIIMLIISLSSGYLVISHPKVQTLFADNTNDKLNIDSITLNGDTMVFHLLDGTDFSLVSTPEKLFVNVNNRLISPEQDAEHASVYFISGNEKELKITMQKSMSSDDWNRLKQIEITTKEEEATPNKMVIWYANSTFYVAKRALRDVDFNVSRINVIKNERAFSHRGYIWNRTLPLVLKSPVYGYGADTFSLIFPQVDPIGKIGVYENNPLTFVDKPHNIYLMLLINFGIIGFAIYMLFSIKVFIKKNLYFSLSILSVLISGIVNDSIIVVGVIVFTLFALNENFNSKEVSNG